MKTLLLLLGFWVLLGLVQCTKDEDPAVVKLGQKIELKKDQSVQVVTAKAPVQLTVTEITDSRCPSGVNCVAPGQADVSVELRDGAGAVQKATLCLGSCSNDSAAVVLDAVPYWLRLTDVNPYPSANARFGPQTATLYLTQQ
ncbi:hypothetical protein [Hymenobacter weizhouensis]|uniref:hypothetical protein n=1 Tax=Hymenobacter sp. YIM 151500-1 TaxID=2987689 RepID=UPI0022263A5C|nr:hypothetical protein [Hymenobacter sp. YIM 151500-1]UYZ62836.1 hypothetical protein OIS53_17785 [Hymenobacter sp. YIM 151500-1]